VRELVEARCGSVVTGAASQGGGFTPGFASVLSCDDGTKHFVKAASAKAQRAFAESYREEARKLQALPDSVPAPRLLWIEDGDWVVLGLQYVEGRAPRRPWRQADLDAGLDALEVVARELTPVPPGLHLDSFADELATWPSYWEHVATTQPGLAHLDEAAALAAGFAEVTGGTTVVHMDVRDDNMLVRRDGTVVLCDWNWPTVGAAWLDSLLLLIGPRGDGLDTDAVIAQRPLLREVPPDHIDRVLAMVIGYFFKSGDDPVPPTSPHLRAHQRWQAEVLWAWLCERRGW
jgi:aminoglycoside phosphotransferase (APT) family kinase protein